MLLSHFSPSRAAQLLFSWFSTAQGHRILQLEKRWLAAATGQCWGDTAFCVTLTPDFLSGESNFSWQRTVWLWSSDLHMEHPLASGLSGACIPMIADMTAWPIANESVPIIVLHHSLEVAVDIHQVLREAARILIPGGHLIILGFNPWSRWGVRRALGRYRAPWVGQMIGLSRLLDWLQLLGFDAEPAHPHKTIYGVLARKRSIYLTPIREKWRNRIWLPSLARPVSVARKQSVHRSL